MEPPMSLPLASMEEPAARLAPDPPEDPPLVMARFQGVRVTPWRRLHVTMADENSGVVVRAWTIPPASMMRCAIGSVLVAISSLNSTEPCVNRCPAICGSSFTATGSPSKGRALPAA